MPETGSDESVVGRSKRVVLVSGTLQLSGSTTWILSLQSALRAIGCPVIHIVVGIRGDVYIPDTHEVFFTGRARSHPLLRIARLLRCHKLFPTWFEEKSDDVLNWRVEKCLREKGWDDNIDLVVKDFTCEAPSIFYRYKLVSVIHQLLSPGWDDPGLRRQARPGAILAAVSHTVANDARRLGLTVDYVLYNPLDSNEIRDRADALAVQDDYLLFVGSLTLGKGVHELLEAYRCAQTKLPLWIIGSGKEQKALQARVQQLGLQDKVRFLGFQANPYPFIKRARLLVLPSRREVPGWAEAMGYVCLEAAVLGTPFLVTDFSAAAEFFEERVTVAHDPAASFCERLGSAMADAAANPSEPGLRPEILALTEPESVARSYLALLDAEHGQ